MLKEDSELVKKKVRTKIKRNWKNISMVSGSLSYTQYLLRQGIIDF